VRKAKRLLTAALTTFAIGALAGPLQAQDYPNRTIEWIVPSSAGSGFDVVTRIITNKLSDVLGQTVVVQNLPGAGGTVGSAEAATRDADGYTVLITNVNHTANEALRPNKPYVLLEDFDPIIRFGVSHYVIVVHPSVEAETLEELLDMAKENPGEINFATAGVGSSTFMLGMMFKSKAGVDVTHIPYEGGGPAVAAVVAGEVDYYGAPYATGKPFIDENQLRPLAVTAGERVPFLPDLPSASEVVPDFAFTSWYGVMMPAGAPDEARQTFHDAMVETLNDPQVKEALTDLGLTLIQEGPDEFRSYLEGEIEVMKAIVSDAGITPQ